MGRAELAEQMGIPEAQLKTWSNDGATGSAEVTHNRIRRVLNAHEWPARVKPDLYLQGSYRNSTTIRADSDVDLVCEITSVFYSNKASALTPAQRAVLDQTYGNGGVSWSQFHAEVLKVLCAAYGRQVDPSTNAIKVPAGQGRLAADVVVTATYKQYIPNPFTTALPNFHQGVTFWADGVRQVVNFPRQHYDNGVNKNDYGRTGERFKPMVRVFKNARRYMVERGLLEDDIAPGYFIQCLLYNVPDYLFLGTFEQAFVAILNWLLTADLNTSWCQNGIYRLFGDQPNEWTTAKARTYLQTLVALWNGWS